MDTAIYIFKQFIIILIDVLHIAMFARAILSWFDQMQEWKITSFLHMLTEPIIMPIRALCEKMNWFVGLPIDIPFLLTWLLLSLLQALLAFM